jgi:methyl-accepting chemotaxis protein
MKWFYNLKIGKKLTICFITVAAIAAVVGFIGISELQTVAKNDESLYKEATVPIVVFGNISNEFLNIRINARDMIYATTQQDKQKFSDNMEQLFAEIAKNLSEFEKTISTDADKKNYDEFVSVHNLYIESIKKLKTLAFTASQAEAVAYLKGEAGAVGAKESNCISKIIQHKDKSAMATSESNMNSANKATISLIVIITGAVILAVLLGQFISRMISKPLNVGVDFAKV